MSYNGSGTFQINTSGQPIVAGTVISSTAFNSLTSDLATGLSTAITKDGQTTTTVQIPFAQGLRSTLVTDSSSISTGSIITDGGVGVAKNLYVGGILNVTGSASLTNASLTNPVINNIKMGYTTTATTAGTTTLTISSNYRQFFTGTSTQTIVLPVTSTLVTGMAYEIENNSTGLLTVNSSGGNLVGTIPAGVCAQAVCIGTTLTTAADWDWDYISTATITGTGANVLGTSPTITSPTLVTPALGTPSALVLTNATGLPQAGLGTNVAGNGPAFSAYQSSAQTLTGATFTKISLQSEEFDTNSNFDSTTNYRFTPAVAGYYQFNAALQVGASASTALITFYKNGSEFKRPTYMSGSSVVNSASGSALIYCNGTSDYVEFYALLGTGQALSASATSTWFQGSMVRSA